MRLTNVLENVVKIYDQVVACDHVSLSIESVETFSILGPSGSGKTRILLLITGIDVPEFWAIALQ